MTAPQATNDPPAAAASAEAQPAVAAAPATEPAATPAPAAAAAAAVAAPQPELSAADKAEPAVAATISEGQQRQPDKTIPAAAQEKENNAGKKPAAASAEKSTAKAQTPLTSLFDKLPVILKEAQYTEMWGVPLSDNSHVPTTVVLQKFLRANDDDVSKAAEQLQKALLWRRDTNPVKLLDEVAFDKEKFGELGYVTTHKDLMGKETVITWNIYGAVKNKQATFGNVDEFIKWRAALMELSVRKLNLNKVTAPIPDGGEDPYRMIQVHDYLNVSFLRMDPAVKNASSETIKVFAMAYPELLDHKYFVNIPSLMGWVFKAMKVFLAPKTIAKFHPLVNGSELANEIPSLKESLPKDYGGNGESIKAIGLTVKLADATNPAASPAATETKAAETKPVENKPAENKPAETKAEETKAADTPALAATTAATSPEPATTTVPQPGKAAEAVPAAAELEKTDAQKTETTELPNVADLSVKDQAEGKEAAASEGAKPAAT